MTGEYGICDRPGCGRPADYLLEFSNSTTGVVAQHPICEGHYRDFTAPCVVDGCNALGHNVLTITGTTVDDTRRTGEARFCHQHYDAPQRSTTVTMDGVRMIHDGHGRLKPLPPEGGRG